MLCASARSACLAPENAANPADPRTLAVAPVKRIVPRPRGVITRATSRPIRKPASAPISHTLRYTRSVVSVTSKRTLAPMLNTATSIGAMSRSMPATSSLICVSSRASEPKPCAVPPSALMRSNQRLELVGRATGDAGDEALAREAARDRAAGGVAGADDQDCFAHAQ